MPALRRGSEIPFGRDPESPGLAVGSDAIAGEGGGDVLVEEVFDTGVETEAFAGLPGGAEPDGGVVAQLAGGEGVIEARCAVFDAAKHRPAVIRAESGVCEGAEFWCKGERFAFEQGLPG